MEPTIIGDCTLYNADCLDVLPTLSGVDAVVTSPPYDAGMEYDHWKSEQEYYGFITNVLDHCRESLRPSGRLVWQVMFTSTNKRGRHFLGGKTAWLIQERFSSLDTFLWSATPLHEFATRTNTAWGSWRSPSCPSMRGLPGLVFVAGKDNHKDPPEGRTSELTADEFKDYTKGLWVIRQDETCRWWPAPFPVEFASRALKLYTYENAVVVDPFTGSGTTGVACVRTNRKFIGIEKDPAYFAIACERIRKAYAEAPLLQGVA